VDRVIRTGLFGDKRMRRLSREIAWLLIVTSVVSGCSLFDVGYTQIGEIAKNPSQFDGKEVKVRGKIVDVMKLPFLETKMYTLKDDTGQILVTTAGEIPAMGLDVRVKGMIENVAIIGGQSLGLHLKESQRW
jgi:hypothetical protein